MSAATTPAFAVGADYSYHQHHSRSKSPVLRTHSKSKNRHDQGYNTKNKHHQHDGIAKSRSRSKSPSMRSLSPFGRHDSSRSPKAKKQNIMVCHESAHAIVFRDHLRLARKIIQEVEDEEDDDEDFGEEKDSGEEEEEDSGAEAEKQFHQMSSNLRSSLRGSLKANESNELVKEINHLAHDLVPELKTVTLDLKNVSERNIEIEGLHAHITPLDELEWNSKTEFQPLLQQPSQEADNWTVAEQEVYQMLQDQKACVKTIQKNEWPSFLKRFQQALPKNGRSGEKHYDIAPTATTAGNNTPFNSFVTSTSLLPSGGKKMRCYGSELSYPVGVVFALPNFANPQEENTAVTETQTWAWPAGYAAKTEFNIDNRGNLINGRQEALVSLEQIRQYNHEYLTKQDHYIAGRIIKGGFNVVPYNECFLRVGGPGRIVNGQDVAADTTGTATTTTTRSLDKGTGLFVALFIRTITMGDIVQLFRTKARIAHVLGEQHVKDIPLLFLHNEHGVKVFTRQLQTEFWKLASCKLQPFPNPTWALTTKYHETNDKSLQHKIDELLALDDIVGNGTSNNNKGKGLSHHELGKIAGGFGITDRSFLTLIQQQTSFQHVHDIMQQGFAATIRADNDYYTARQMLILYCLANTAANTNLTVEEMIQQRLHGIPAASYSDPSLLKKQMDEPLTKLKLPAPLATKRWRRATNAKGLLVVLGAAQILKTITTTSAKRRTDESIEAVEEWVHHGEESVAFRVASWREQRADEAEANIAMSTDSKFMAFVTNKSVHNRRKFAQQLRKAAPDHQDFTSVGFLRGIYDIVDHMHSPCMRLELLQYILALDNRYSVELIKESIELAATCLSLIPK